MNNKTYKDGVYFNLPFDEYLEIERFSSHGVVELNRSRAGFGLIVFLTRINTK